MSKYSISEFAKLTGYTQQTLRNWEASGKLKPYRNGELGHRRYSQEQLDEILGTDSKASKLKGKIVGYFKIDNQVDPLAVTHHFDRLRSYIATISVGYTQTVDLQFDVYSVNDRTVGLDNYNDLLSSVARHEVSDIVFLCHTIQDYYEYKAVSSLIERLNVQVHLLKNNVLSQDVSRDRSLVELISELSVSCNYTQEDILKIVATLESNLGNTISCNIKELKEID